MSTPPAAPFGQSSASAFPVVATPFGATPFGQVRGIIPSNLNAASAIATTSVDPSTDCSWFMGSSCDGFSDTCHHTLLCSLKTYPAPAHMMSDNEHDLNKPYL